MLQSKAICCSGFAAECCRARLSAAQGLQLNAAQLFQLYAAQGLQLNAAQPLQLYVAQGLQLNAAEQGYLLLRLCS